MEGEVGSVLLLIEHESRVSLLGNELTLGDGQSCDFGRREKDDVAIDDRIAHGLIDSFFERTLKRLKRLPYGSTGGEKCHEWMLSPADRV